jgi:hypothetical protein
MKVLYFCVAALAASAPSFTQAAVPTAPSLTAGAQFKGLQFDWDAVSGASWYQLELRAHRTGAFVQQGDDFPASTTSARITFPLHLFDWTYARYRLAACNSDGCSYSPEVSVSDLRLDAVGYFKTYLTASNHQFGKDADISSDGLNFVATAPGETIYAGTTQDVGGVIYVYGKVPGSGWQRRARLQPTIAPWPGYASDPEDHQQMAVSISGDGNMVALGKPYYFKEEFDNTAGEVWIFRYNGSAWVRTRLARPATGFAFGSTVSLNDAGDLLAVTYGGSEVELYRLASGSWQHVHTIDSSDPNGRPDSCGATALSLDGSTIAQACIQPKTSTLPARDFIRVFSGANWQTRAEIPVTLPVKSGSGSYSHASIGIDRSGSTIAEQVAIPPGLIGNEAYWSEVQVFHRSGSAWSKAASLQPGAWRNDPAHLFHYGLELSVSGDGSTIAVADDADNGWGKGVRAAPLNPTDSGTGGAAYIYRLSGTWKLANMVKPNYLLLTPRPRLSNNGKTLIIGSPGDGSRAIGVGGDWHNNDRPGSGAVWLY